MVPNTPNKDVQELGTDQTVVSVKKATIIAEVASVFEQELF